MNKKINILLLLLFCAALRSYAQIDRVLLIGKEGSVIKTSRAAGDSVKIWKDLSTIVQKSRREGFLTASIDSFYIRNDTFFAVFYQGPLLKWAHIQSSNMDPSLLRKIGFHEKSFHRKKLNPEDLFRVERKILKYANNHGYPFASVKLDSLQFEDNMFSGILKLTKGKKFVMDSIHFPENVRLSKPFLHSYLQLKKGEEFDQRKLNSISRLIKSLPGVEETRSHQVYFHKNKFYVKLYLKSTKVNGVDGIIGFQQDPQNNKMLFTGHFDLNLQNISGSGKSVLLNWKKTDRNSQLINFSYHHRNLFRTKINGKAKYNLFKQDTSFIQRKPYIELSYSDQGLNHFKFFYQLDDSRIIGNSTSVSTNPALANVRTSYYGIGLEQNSLDDIFFPTEGYSFDIGGSLGSKNILDDEVTEMLGNEKLQWKTNAQLEWYAKIKKYLGVFASVQAAYLKNKNLFLNELYRLGGIRSIRGFQENTFYASEYVIGKLEGRFYLEDRSFLLAFVDYGFYEAKISGDKPPHSGPPIGMGIGLTMSTKTGIFSFVYGVGREGNNPLNFNNSVVNFGLTSQF